MCVRLLKQRKSRCCSQGLRPLFATVFGALALVLATTGIYGVVAYRTQLRTQEIGIRVALGATRSDVLQLVLFQGVRLTAAGLLAGPGRVFRADTASARVLYGVSASDPLTAACVSRHCWR